MTTTKTKHTPGPWKAESNQVITLAVIGQERVHGYGCENDFICDLNDGEYHEYFSKEEQVANANLIASAPELLSCLKELVECYEHLDDGQCEEFQLARLAIRKAEGTL